MKQEIGAAAFVLIAGTTLMPAHHGGGDHLPELEIREALRAPTVASVGSGYVISGSAMGVSSSAAYAVAR